MLGGISTKITRSPSSSSGRNSLPSLVADDGGGDEECGNGACDHDAMSSEPGDRVHVALAEPSEERGFLDLRVLDAQGDGAERGNHGEREDEGAEQGEAVGQRKRSEDSTFDALQREHRDQRGNDDGHCEERRTCHGDRGTHNQRQQIAPPFGLLRAASWRTFSARTTAPSTRMPKSTAPIEMRFAGRWIRVSQ
jgi:hypothetical protein